MQPIANIYQYLKFCNFIDLQFWDYYTLSHQNIVASSYPIVELSAVITQRKKFITINDDKKYKRCRVQVSGKGVLLRDIVLGKEIKTKKQQLCKKNDFLVAEIDAKVGGFGIVPQELEDAVVSGHYFLFEIDTEKLLPEFLALIVKTNDFQKQVKSTGSTNYAAIRPYHVLAYKIPLPSVNEQKALVKNYFAKIEEAENLNQQASTIQYELEIYLNKVLGYKIKKSQPLSLSNYFRVIDFSSLEKWGVDKNSESKLTHSNSYQTKKIKELCAVGSGGTPSRSIKEYYNGNIPWIKTGEVLNNIIYDTEEKITQEAVANSSAKIYPKDSLIIAMYGQGLTRGRTAKLGIEASTNQACAVLFNINNDLILTDFLWIYLMGEYHRLRALASGNNQPNLNAQMIKDYDVIIPPFEVQNQIIEYFNSQNDKIKQLQHQSEQLKIQAQQEFEKGVFKL